MQIRQDCQRKAANASEAAPQTSAGVFGSLIALNLAQRGSAASLESLKGKTIARANAYTPEQNLTCLQRVLPFKDSSYSQSQKWSFRVRHTLQDDALRQLDYATFIVIVVISF